MKFLTVIIYLPRSAYVVSDSRQEITRKLIRIVAVCLAKLLFDLLLTLQFTLHLMIPTIPDLQKTLQNISFAGSNLQFTLHKTLHKTLQNIIYGFLPPIWAV